MRTTLDAIQVLPNGKEITVKFSVQENHQQAIRAAAEFTMGNMRGTRKVHGWRFGPDHKVRDANDNVIEPIPCPWYGLAEAKALGIPLPKPEDA